MVKDQKPSGNATKKTKDNSGTQRTLHELIAFLPSSSPSSSQAGPSKGFRPRDLGKSVSSTKSATARTTRGSAAASSSSFSPATASASSKTSQTKKPTAYNSTTVAAAVEGGSAQISNKSTDMDTCAEDTPPGSPLKILRSRKTAPSAFEPLASSSRRTRLATSKQKASQPKRKRPDSDDETSVDAVTVPLCPPSTLDRDGPLTPKDNVPSTRSRTSLRGPSPPKKARLSPPEAAETSTSGRTAGTSEIVPSSQSDERELAAVKPISKASQEVKESVTRWRAQALAREREDGASPDNLSFPDCEMRDDAVMNNPSAAHSLRPETSVQNDADISHPSSPEELPSREVQLPAQSPLTPLSSAFDLPRSSSPLSEPSSAPRSPSPVILNPETKTAQILAEIQAKYARDSSPEAEPLEFNDMLSESSDEDDEVFFPPVKKSRNRAKLSSPDASTSKVAEISQEKSDNRRYNLRRKSSGQNLPLPPTPESASPPRNIRKPRKKADPLDFLLKEKRATEKRGAGEEALDSAEKVAASAQEMQNLEELEADNGSFDEAWVDERAAMKIAEGADKRKSLSPSSAGDLADEGSDCENTEEVNQSDRKRILGDKSAKAVGEILKKDRQDRETRARAVEEKRTLDVSFWEAPAIDTMDVQGAIPQLPANVGKSSDPLLRRLCQCVEENDEAQLSLLLQSGLLSTLHKEHLPHILLWLFRVAATDLSGAQSACCSAMQICASGDLAGVYISFASTLDVLCDLGARTALLQSQGWTITSRAASRSMTSEARSAAVERTVHMFAKFTECSMLSPADAPDAVLLLLLIALDPTTSSQLQTDIAISLEQLCNSVLAGSSSAMGQNICTRIVNFSRGLTPPSQQHIARLLIGGHPHTSYLARWVVYCLLVDAAPPSPEQYRRQPPLQPIIALLSPLSGSVQPFDIPGNAKREHFYEDLTCRVEILGKFLTVIDGYVAEEKAVLPRESSPVRGDGDSKIKEEKSLSLLEQIRYALENLHSKIIDTRAAHLDRSKAKAALQQLAIRLHYQRNSCLRSAPRSRKLDGYFTAWK